MGRSDSALKVSEQIRPWFEAGFRYVLVSGANRWQQMEDDQPSSSATKTPASFQGGKSHARPSNQSLSVRAPQTPQASPGKKATPFSTLWTQYWNSVTKKPKVIFTYYELGQDLTGNPDPARRSFFQQLMNRLTWPKGTCAFWPMAAYHDNSHYPDESLFWRGAIKLMAGYMACFGEQALSVICPGAKVGQVVMKNDVLVYALPSIEDLARMEQDAFESAIKDISALRF